VSPHALLDEVRAYLRRNGWVEQGHGIAGALWARGTDDQTELAVIAVPDHIQIGSVEWSGVVERLAAYERRSVNAVTTAIRDQYVDVARLRAANDVVIEGSIPLGAGVSLVASAHQMLRACATTAQRPRAQIRGHYSRFADEVVRQARLGHTSEGSYIIPILMPVSEPPADDVHERPIESLESGRVPHEPIERRVTRTFAQALTAVEQRIVQPAKQPRLRDIGPIISAGVSRELVTALYRVVADPAVATFEAAFVWAGALTPPASVPAEVVIPSEAADLLRTTERLLRSPKIEPPRTITGPVVEIHHAPGDPSGWIVVQTIQRGRPADIRVLLRQQELDPAHDWMRTARTIVVAGQIVRPFGQSLRIERPEAVYPLDETFLPSEPV
jgi:hypothetical protein